ncbi:MAG: thioredoxin domain-containing protein [Oscillospiraceae bacterium]|jgi:uncharacterized protein YyaL (SSP411 family)
MERESFEDKEVARLLNENFVSIKVDREERPDVDSFYMDACVAMNGSGGWPLSCFLDHDRRPFFAGTYFPKNDGPYGTGFLTILERITRLWKNKRDELFKLSESLVRYMDQKASGGDPPPGVVASAFDSLSSRFDEKFGGFGGAPKFPSFSSLLFLIRYYYLKKSRRAMDMFKKTLDSMYQGGIFDHIGGGFCRYSTDEKWLVPHFEKMMTDNALHILIYSEAAAVLSSGYGAVSRRISEFCTREMMDTRGGFYTATDADSEGVEGKYYVFTPEEIAKVLGDEDGQRYCRMYDITPGGNFEGKSIPNLIGISLNENDIAFAKKCNEKLLQYRKLRVPPFMDDKILVSVNGLMIAALSVQGRILKDKSIVKTAENCARFVISSLVRNGRLLARWRDGEAGISANSDNYACLIWGLVELYQATLNPKWLKTAVELTKDMDGLFWDSESGGYFLSGSDMDQLPVRQKNFLDGAIPSGNGIMALNLIRLSRICAEPKYEEKARAIIRCAAEVLEAYPAANCTLLCCLQYLEDGGTEIVLANGRGFEELLAAIPAFSPFTVVSACGEGYEEMVNLAPYLKQYRPVDGKAAAYVCKGGSCRSPITSVKELTEVLK